MFSGIIEEIGSIHSIERHEKSKMIRLVVESKLLLGDMKVGESIAVNGACLTLIETDKNKFLTEVSPETAQKTNLGQLVKNERVNLERALQLNQRLNGHMVSGHVDTLIKRLNVETVEDGAILWYELPEDFTRYVIAKGSVALNGVSLTVNSIDKNKFSVFLIPHSIRHTNLLDESLNYVNLEVDMIGKYIEQMVSYSLGVLK